MKCEKCNNEHDGSFASGRFCSRECANSRGKRSKKTKQKISEGMKSSQKFKDAMKATRGRKKILSDDARSRQSESLKLTNKIKREKKQKLLPFEE
jgi:hypothetical protein